jgi:hypothetical protein
LKGKTEKKMNSYEVLLNRAYEDNIDVIEDYKFSSEKLKGLYSNNIIALSDKLNSKEKNCILAEELGHHYTTVGNIIDFKKIKNAKAEEKARLWAYDDRIGLRGLIKGYEHNCKSRFELAELLEVTEDFLNEAIETYKNKYGQFIKIDNYLITFIPNLNVIRLFEE